MVTLFNLLVHNKIYFTWLELYYSFMSFLSYLVIRGEMKIALSIGTIKKEHYASRNFSLSTDSGHSFTKRASLITTEKK